MTYASKLSAREAHHTSANADDLQRIRIVDPPAALERKQAKVGSSLVGVHSGTEAVACVHPQRVGRRECRYVGVIGKEGVLIPAQSAIVAQDRIARRAIEVEGNTLSDLIRVRMYSRDDQ